VASHVDGFVCMRHHVGAEARFGERRPLRVRGSPVPVIDVPTIRPEASLFPGPLAPSVGSPAGSAVVRHSLARVLGSARLSPTPCDPTSSLLSRSFQRVTLLSGCDKAPAEPSLAANNLQSQGSAQPTQGSSAGAATPAAVPVAPPPTPTQPNAVPAPEDVAAPPADARKTPSGLALKVLTPGKGKDHPGRTTR